MSCESYKITTVEVLGMRNNWESFGVPTMPTWVLSCLCLSPQVITVKTCVQAALFSGNIGLKILFAGYIYAHCFQ